MPWARSFCPFRACCFWSFWAFSPYLNHMRNFSAPYYIRMREREKLLIYETKHVWKSFHNFANRTEDENQSNNLIKYKL
jgi:hypothetical protein